MGWTSGSQSWTANGSILRSILLGVLICSAVVARDARADGQLQDFVRIRGMESDVLIGMGLVLGLNGTGDSMKDSMIAGQPYAQFLKTIGNIDPTQRDLLKLKSIAIVFIRAEIPPAGARIGDRLDVRVSVAGSAKSLEGGELVSTFLMSDVVPSDRTQWVPYAMAGGGPIELGDSPTNGLIRGGGRVVRDIIKSPFDGASVLLVLKPQYFGIPSATAIADEINQELVNQDYAGVAVVEDAATIRVRLPEGDPQSKPHEFISNLLTLSMSAAKLRLPSRIVIDKQNQVMTIDENVEFRAVAITVGSLRITTITPPIEPTAENPIAESSTWAGVGTGKNKVSDKLKDLIKMLEQFDVPFDSQVAVVQNLEKMGAITATIITP
ncbi:MAG: flagellar basal body P-ring protein FlgI [Phycisphaerae bacterium]|nr:flagellar basal body P-ring protein FlgI [Phycisphaerae bacterium]